MFILNTYSRFPAQSIPLLASKQGSYYRVSFIMNVTSHHNTNGWSSVGPIVDEGTTAFRAVTPNGPKLHPLPLHRRTQLFSVSQEVPAKASDGRVATATDGLKVSVEVVD